MDKQAAIQYHKTLSELLNELRAATSPDIRAPIVARMHNVLFPMHVVDTRAAQHIQESLAKLKHPEQAIVNAANQTISEALDLFQKAIAAHPEEPFVVYGDSERVYFRPVSYDELNSLKERGRLMGAQHEPYLKAIESNPKIEKVFRSLSREDLAPVFERMGFPNSDALAFFTTRAHPKLGVPADKMPSVLVCTLRGGVPINLVKHHQIA